MTQIDHHESGPLDWIAGRQQAMVDTLIDWSAHNTGSRNIEGLTRFAAKAAEAFSPLGARIETRDPAPAQTLDPAGQVIDLAHGPNLLITQRPEAPIQVLLTGHMDTVFPRDHGFQTATWLDAGTLNGPGVADMKGGVLILLHALLALERSPWAANIGYRVILNSDEEVSSLGSAPLLRECGRIADLGLVFEPSMLPDGTLAGARKGIGTFAISAQGVAAHAGRNPEAGRNAILAIARYFVAIQQLHGMRDGLTVNAARIEGGGPTNVVPDQAVGRFEVRAWTPEDAAWAESELHRIADEVSRQCDVRLALHGHFHRPPKPMTPEAERLFEAVRECGRLLGQTITWKPSGGCCDGNNLAAVGLPVVDTLGVRGGKIHSSEEFCIVESLSERAQLAALLLMRLASGKIHRPGRIS